MSAPMVVPEGASPLAAHQTPTTPDFRHLLIELRPVVRDSVDVLHVAALLESRGITDALAQERYDSEDVFGLAASLRAGVREVPADGADASNDHPGSRMVGPRLRRPGQEVTIARSTVGHGAIYLLPALSMPALLALTGPTYAVLALMVGGALGWLWAAVTSWRAYAEWSRHGQRPAELMMVEFTLLGVGVGVAAGLVLALQVSLVVGLVATAVTAAQVSTTLLFFRRRRAVLVVILLMPSAVGVAYLAAPGLVPAAAVLVLFLLACLLALAVGSAPLFRQAPLTWPRPSLAWVTAPGMAWVAGYAVAAVAFLLLPQGVLMRSAPHAVMALAGLFLAMGVVEWRAARLTASLRGVLRTAHGPTAFRSQAAALAAGEGLLCLCVTAALSGVALLGLRAIDLSSAHSEMVALAAVLLGAVYLLAQVLANAGAYPWVTAAFALGVSVEVMGTLLGAQITSAFVVAAGVVLVALFVGLLITPVHRFR